MARRIAVAASGGRDSTALLHAASRAARQLGIEVHALHVHHGLMPQADEWLAQVRGQCLRWARAGLPVQFHSRRLTGAPAPGDSIEAWARRERYAALTAMAREQGIDAVLLAHHRRDQAETFLLQALRGGGPAGLAAMPARAEREGICWLRPWLDHSAEAIEAYVRRHRLRHVDDASNRDPRFARSRLRVDVWPALGAAFADAEAALAGAARRAREAAQCLQELAAADAAHCVDVQGRLAVAAWQRLSPARRANVLRHWLGQASGAGVPDSLVQRMLRELPAARTGAAWPAPAGTLRLHRGALRHDCAATAPRGSDPLRMDLSRPGRHDVPSWGGGFVVQPAAGQGIAARLLAQAEIRPRQGSEQFQRSARSAARSLKKQYQAAGVPASERAAPLVHAGGRLVFVPGLGIDARAMADPDEPALTMSWQPDGRP